MFDYLPLIVTLIGGILGLTGQAWDSNKKSRIKFTKRGWMSIAVITLGFSVSGVVLYRTKVSEDYEQRQRQLVKEIVNKEISYSCYRLVNPFIDMYIARRIQKNEVPQSKSEREMANALVSDATIAELQWIDFFQPPSNDVTGIPKEDANYVAAVQYRFKTEPIHLKEILRTYSLYLEPKQVALIHNIVNHHYLGVMLSLPTKNGGPRELYPFDSYKVEDHKDFCSKVIELWETGGFDEKHGFKIVKPSDQPSLERVNP